MTKIARTSLAWLLCSAGWAWANVAPNTPTITEPGVEGQIVNPADVHMETAPFSDPDVGDTHVCTDWEIWTESPSERVWLTACIGGVERLHTHLGDGTFEGSHAGRSELLFDADYRLRVRHRDSSGDPGTEWSLYAERLFRTGPPSSVFPLELQDVSVTPAPRWIDGGGADVILPAGGPAPSLRLESPLGELLFEFRGLDGSSNQITNPGPLSVHAALRLIMSAGAAGNDLVLVESTLALTDGDGVDHTLYLPAASVPPAEPRFFWVSANGSTYVGGAAQASPDFSTLARGAPVPWAVRQAGYQVEIVATGFQLPVNIAFVPNPGPGPNAPMYYVAELYGTIKVVTRGGVVSDYATNLLNFDPTGEFPGSGEQGLTGVAVDPLSGDVLAALLYDSAADPGTHYPKVMRFTSADGGLTAAAQVTILDMAGESQGQSHQISNVSIGPDGKLYVHMGDGFDFTTAQDLDSFRGKVLRMNLDGTAAAGSPFYNAGDGVTARDYVFAYGLRNPFGGAWRGSDDSHYEVENGPSVDRFARIVAGRNYLWDGSDASMFNFAIYNWVPANAPVNIAFTQPGTFGGSGFPANKMDHAFVAESGPTWATGPQSNGKRISEFVLDPAGDLLSGPTPLIEYDGGGKATAVALAAGPDGLYFSDLYKDTNYVSPIDRGANVLRIKFVGSAEFTADVTLGAAPLMVQFTDLSNVSSPTDWLWNFGDGGSSPAQNPSHTYMSDGIYTVRLRVTGANGVSVRQKNAYIRVGFFPSVAMLSGFLPAGASDAAIADHLRSLGFSVDAFDDDPGSRPSASQLAADYALVIVSSTCTSANIAGEFRDVAVPLLYWEQALNRLLREPLADDGAVLGGASGVMVLNNSHPITTAVPLGPVEVFASPSNMSVARPPFAPGVIVLATRDGAPNDAAVMAADAGAVLLGGHIAPARRAFLFYEDDGWFSTTPVSRQIFEQAVYWAMGLPIPTVRPDLDGDRDVDLDDWNALRSCLSGPGITWGTECGAADLDGDGDVDLSEVRMLQRCFSTAGVIAPPGCDD